MPRPGKYLGLVGVVAVALVLSAVVTVGVQRMQAAAARMRCQNNLKQLGIAAHNFHDSNGHIPPGTAPDTELPPDQRLGFLLLLLPYTESTKVYAKMDLTAAWDSPTNVSAVGNFAPALYLCPAWAGRQEALPAGHLAVTNYVGVAGVGADAATRPADAPGVGIFGYDRTTNLRGIKDGTQNTALMFETSRDPAPWVRGGPGTVRAVEPEDAPLAGTDRAFGGTHLRKTWALRERADGFNVLFADASVRFTKPDVGAAILGALATAAGGEELPPEW